MEDNWRAAIPSILASISTSATFQEMSDSI